MADAELPSLIDDQSAWTAGDFATPRSWVRALDADMIDEIAAVTEAIILRGTPFSKIAAGSVSAAEDRRVAARGLR